MYYINGRYVTKAEEANISILDLAILRGFSVFDFLRTYKGRPFHLQDHLLRLQYSAAHVGLTLPHTLEEMEQIVLAVQKQYGAPEASLKMLITGGTSSDQFTPCPQNSCIVFAYPLTSFPSHYYTEGVKVITTRLNRSLPTAKTTQYTPAIVAMQKGRAQNAVEALYLNAQDEILEATTSNFFAFKGDTLYTCCSDEVLIGITSAVVQKIASHHYPIQTRALHYSQLPEIKEAFLTSSNKEILPIIQVDSTTIGNGKVGVKTQHLMDLFRTYTQGLEWPALNIPRYKV